LTVTAWLKPPEAINGQDHLATMAPCVALYSQLLPGITNVTERARAYSFYPWLFFAIEQSDLPRDPKHLVEWVRRAECLWCLVGLSHELEGEPARHGIGMTGRDRLAKVWERLVEGRTIRLSTYAAREEGQQRYFKNSLGGFGQYYLGTFRELRILDGDSRSGIQYDRKRGVALAQVFAKGVDGRRFLKVLEQDSITSDDVKKLSSFCPCGLTSNREEQTLLLDLFFDRPGVFYDDADLPRRHTLNLLLDLAARLRGDQEAAPNGLDSWPFRACVYTGALGPGRKWELPPKLEQTRLRWSVYQRSEVLSLATQAVFWALLTWIQESGSVFGTSREAGEMFARLLGKKALIRPADRFDQALRRHAESIPSLDQWAHEDHEIERCKSLILDGDGADSDPAEVVATAVHVLLSLAARDMGDDPPYSGFVFEPGYFDHYPINLMSFRELCRGTWSRLTLAQWLASLSCDWGIDVHFRVALRKLRFAGKDTFRVKPLETGLDVVAPWPPAPTSPRFGKAFQILRDLGALDVDGDAITRITPLGSRLFEGVARA
jgi:hypothetical protein